MAKLVSHEGRQSFKAGKRESDPVFKTRIQLLSHEMAKGKEVVERTTDTVVDWVCLLCGGPGECKLLHN